MSYLLWVDFIVWLIQPTLLTFIWYLGKLWALNYMKTSIMSLNNWEFVSCTCPTDLSDVYTLLDLFCGQQTQLVGVVAALYCLMKGRILLAGECCWFPVTDGRCVVPLTFSSIPKQWQLARILHLVTIYSSATRWSYCHDYIGSRFTWNNAVSL